jgi:hypothetical protein
MNYYAYNPLRVIHINPIKGTVTGTTCILSNVPVGVKTAINRYAGNPEKHGETLRDHFGAEFRDKLIMSGTGKYLDRIGKFKAGGDELSGDAFAKLLDEAQPEDEAPTAAPVEKYQYVDIYNDDRLYELRDKIAIATGIPIYKQHLFWLDSNTIEGMYTIKLDMVYRADIVNISGPPMYGIPIDRTLMQHKNGDYSIIIKDMTQLVGAIDTIYLVSLDEFFTGGRLERAAISANLFEFEMIYYGFVLKYFPQMSPDIFKMYLDGGDITAEYPDICINDTLRERYAAQSRLQAITYGTTLDKIKLFTAISSSTVEHGLGHQINIRNLFDLFETSQKIPAIILHDGTYTVTKKNIYERPISIKLTKARREAVAVNLFINLRAHLAGNWPQLLRDVVEERPESIICISIHPNGQMLIDLSWDSEQLINFENNEWIIFNLVNPMIAQIAALVGQKLRKVLLVNYSSLNMSIIWRHVVSSGGFKKFTQFLSEFITADILSVKQSKTIGVTEYIFKKGMYEFANEPTAANQYAYLTNATAKNFVQFNQLGKILYIFHKITNIKFEVFNITKDEFNKFIKYIKLLVYRFEKTYVDDEAESGDYSKLKKLRELDPELFNIRKLGSEKTYSEICQQKYQPKAISAAEFAKLDKDRATSYWNFTLDVPAYYYCDEKHAKYITYLTGKHPKGYCLPCCKKISSYSNAATATVMDKCSADHVYTDVREKSASHILNSAKHVPEGRIAQLIPELCNFLQTSAHESDLYTAGVRQVINATRVGILFILEYVTEIPAADLVAKMGAMLIKNPLLFHVFLSGELVNSFASPAELVATMKRLFIDGDTLYENTFNHWNDLFIEMAFCFLRVILLGMTDKRLIINNRIRASLGACSCSEFRICLFYMWEDSTYPIVRMLKNRDIIKTFCSNNNNNAPGEYASIMNLLDWNKTENEPPGLVVARKFLTSRKLEIVKYYLYANNLCYAIEASDGMFFPINPTYVDVADDLISFDYYSGDRGPTRDEMIKVIDAYNLIVIKAGYRAQAILKTITYRGLAVGLRTTSFTWHNQASPVATGVETIGLNYDLKFINDTINQYIRDRKKTCFDGGKMELYTAELYKNTLYQQLTYELANIVEKNENATVRQKVYDLIRQIKTNSKMLEGLRVMLSFSDYLIIDTLIKKYQHYRNAARLIIDSVTNSRFEFDNQILHNLRQSKTIKADIMALFAGIVTMGPIGDNSENHKNMIFSCETGNGFCDRGKVIIADEKLYADFVDILADDIGSGRFETYIMPNVHTKNYLNYFNFIERPTEKITIYEGELNN